MLAVVDPNSSKRNENDLIFYNIEGSNQGFRLPELPTGHFSDLEEIARMCTRGGFDRRVKLKLKPPVCDDDDDDDADGI